MHGAFEISRGGEIHHRFQHGERLQVAPTPGVTEGEVEARVDVGRVVLDERGERTRRVIEIVERSATEECVPARATSGVGGRLELVRGARDRRPVGCRFEMLKRS